MDSDWQAASRPYLPKIALSSRRDHTICQLAVLNRKTTRDELASNQLRDFHCGQHHTCGKVGLTRALQLLQRSQARRVAISGNTCPSGFDVGKTRATVTKGASGKRVYQIEQLVGAAQIPTLFPVTNPDIQMSALKNANPDTSLSPTLTKLHLNPDIQMSAEQKNREKNRHSKRFGNLRTLKKRIGRSIQGSSISSKTRKVPKVHEG